MRIILCGMFFCTLLISCSTSPQLSQPAETPPLAHRFDVLVFSKTVGWRHDSIEAGIAALKQMGETHNFNVVATEDSPFFTDNDLSQFEAIIFLNTTLDVFNLAEQEAFKAYIQQGGGFVGIHAAADTEYDWEWYGGLVGGYFESHPDRQNADVLFTDRQHPATAHMPVKWNHYDEWYNYKANPRPDVHVLAVVDEQTYEGGNMGHDHPIAWAHLYDGGRAFYTGLGHTIESYSEPLFLEHLQGAIEWAADQVEADVTATLASSYDEVVLTGELTDPMELDITNDGRVFIIEWAGNIKIWEPDTQKMRVIGWLPAEKKIEDGLLGLALDPNFDENGWLYIYYSPIQNGQSFNRLSRFTYDGYMINMSSEIAMLEIPNQRVRCCHSAGSLQFDSHGNLYLSTGDNSGGERDAEDETVRRIADQGRTAANTNDLRGKILRITPQPDGTYTIPEGNLFEADSLHRGEIFTMGHRNPFRYSVDNKTGWIYWGDVGPGSGNGFDEFNQAKGPGFFGWPLFTGKNLPFDNYHVAGKKGQMAPYTNPEAPINASAFNTGARELPPAQPSMIPYLYGFSEEFPELGAGGMNPMGGPVFHYDASSASPLALPPYFDDKVMIYEWMRNWIQVVTLDDNGDLLKIDPFLPGFDYIRPIDIEVAPDGRLYILEWGDEFWGSNPNAQLVRLDYYGPNKLPEKMENPEKEIASHLPISIQTPVDGGFFDFSESIDYTVTLEDQALADQVYIQTYTGFDTSPIPLERTHGLEGTVKFSEKYTPNPKVLFVDRFARIEACLEDGGAVVCDMIELKPRLLEAEFTSFRENAERKTYSARPASQHWGGTALTAIVANLDTRLEYTPINFEGINSITIRFRTEHDVKLNLEFGDEEKQPVGSLALRADAGDLIVPAQARYLQNYDPESDSGLKLIPEGAYNNWREITLLVQNPAGSHTLTLSFEGDDEEATVELDFLLFNGEGVSGE